MPNIIVELKNVSLRFKEKVLAINNVSLKVNHGEFVVLFGPSGSGKSTLFNLIAGLYYPDKGTIKIDGNEPKTLGEWAYIRSKQIGFVFQSFNLLPALTAVENVEIPMFGVVRNAHERRKKALHLLQQVGLENRIKHKPSELSGGECQRVAIARSLANSPSLILADEPTGNLDTKASTEIINLLIQIQQLQNLTLIIVTHDNKIASNARRIVILKDGRLMSDRLI